MKVVHLGNNDIGGAGIAAVRLHRALHANGIPSSLLTKQKHASGIPHHEQFNPTGQLIKKIGVKLGLVSDPIRENARLHLAGRPEGYEHFSFPFSEMDLTQHRLVKDADLLHLHWVSDGFLDFASFFQTVDKPVVWTLHDMNPFTGGCHHADDSLGYTEGCHSCPQLRNTVDPEYAAEILKLKLEALSGVAGEKLRIIAPSEWMKKCSMESRLFGGLQHFTIPNLADTQTFFPLDKNECRKKLGLPADKKIILFAAKDIDNPRKGIRYLEEAMKQINRDVLICSVGKAGPSSPGNFNFGYVESASRMNTIYNAADVFVLPSLAENFPNTVCEALLCGVPVCAFNIGGLPELVKEANGKLAEYKNAASLKSSIEFILENENLFSKKEIAAEAKIKFDPVAIVNRHLEVYRSFKTD